MRRKIPSTVALAAFEAAARHQSYTQAADELAVTQSAVCRQIAGLESFLGVRLFRRSSRGVALTEAGRRYAAVVATRLSEVERDTLDVMASGGAGGALELGVVPTFATRWLLPRLPAFAERHPGVHLNLTAQTRPFLFDETPFDAALHAGTGLWPGTEGIVLLEETLVAVCSPALAAGRQELSARDWRRMPLLQQSTRPYVWRQWFASRGIAVEGDLAGPRLELFSMLAEAACHGLGAALVPPFLVEDELKRGSLVAISRHRHASGLKYHLLYPPHKAADPLLAALRGWLEQQAAISGGGRDAVEARRESRP